MDRLIFLLIAVLIAALLGILALLAGLDLLGRNLEKRIAREQLRQDIQTLAGQVALPELQIGVCRTVGAKFDALRGISISDETALDPIREQVINTCSGAARCYLHQTLYAIDEDMGWLVRSSLGSMAKCLSIASRHQGLTLSDQEQRVLNLVNRLSEEEEAGRDVVLEEADAALPVLEQLLNRLDHRISANMN